MAKNSFILHLDSLSILDKLSMEQRGEFITAIRNYKATGENPVDFWLQMAIEPFINQFARDDGKYADISLMRSELGRKGGVAKASKSKQRLAKRSKSADSDSERESDSERYTFDQFWDLYGKKTDRENAVKAWDKLSWDEKKQAVEKMDNHKAGKEKKYWKNGQGYLNGKRWLDEPDGVVRPTGITIPNPEQYEGYNALMHNSDVYRKKLITENGQQVWSYTGAVVL